MGITSQKPFPKIFQILFSKLGHNIVILQHVIHWGFMLLRTTSDDLPFYFYNVFECECLENGDIVLLFML